MRGKRIGTVAGTSSQYFLASWLLFHNLQADSVTVVALAPEHLASALQRGELDAVAIWEPEPSIALKWGKNWGRVPACPRAPRYQPPMTNALSAQLRSSDGRAAVQPPMRAWGATCGAGFLDIFAPQHS